MAASSKSLHPWKKHIVDRSPIESAINYAECLVQPDGPGVGQPFKMGEFQKEIFEALGHDANGDRVVNTILITMPRKGGKSTLISVLVLLMLTSPESVRFGQSYSCAFDRGQATIIFKFISQIIAMVPELAGRINVVQSKKELTDTITGATFQALSNEGRSHHGKSSFFLISV